MAVPDFIGTVADATKVVLDPLGINSAILGGASDRLNPDQSARLSAILARNGWGAPNSSLNRRARGAIQKESNGDPNAESKAGPCSPTGDIAVGLFQLCSVHKGKWGSPRDREGFKKWAKDPDNNAKGARALHRTAGWQPWASSAPHAETDWDPEVVTDKDTIVGGAGEVASAVASPFAAVGTAAVDLIGTLLSRDTWFRIGKTGLGGVFVILGTGALVFIVANTVTNGGASKAVKTTAKVAVTKGKVK